MTQDALHRAGELTRQWSVTVDEVRTTNTSVLLFGRRGTDPIVLKVVRQPGDEWCSGSVLKAFSGNGVVRVLEVTEGAVLLQRVLPGTSLLELVLAGRDDEATAIIADVIERMWSTESPETSTTEDWARGFDRYLDGKDKAIPLDVVREARKEYLDLCASQRDRRLLHGDLHHGNVLFDADRGWLAIDPKGVLGETEFEIGAVLLNPIAHPELFASQECARRRVTTFEKALKLDGKRILRWAFARAVLSAIWTMEDGDSSDNMHSALMLAREIQRMV